MSIGKSRAKMLAAIALVLVLSAPQFAAAEIPHENFDLVSSSLNVVLQLLNQSINATELACVSCLDQRPYDGDRNLSLVDTVLVPVGELIVQIQEMGGIETNLTYLVPPFENLSEGGHQFIANQSGFLSNVASLKQQVGKALTPMEAYAAAQQLTSVRLLINSMDSDLDDMWYAADEIGNLTVEGKMPFDTVYLKELIDRLRIMLNDYIDMLDGIFWTIKWIDPFITFGVEKQVYYLGEIVEGTGLVYDGHAPLANATVYIDMDNTSFNFTTAVTDQNGAFDFAWTIPLDPVWLGPHSFAARVWMNATWYYSNPQADIEVEKIPTYLSLTLDDKRYSPGQSINATAYLRDYKGGPVVNYSLLGQSQIVSIMKGEPAAILENIVFVLDGAARMNGTTIGWGTFDWTFPASTLSFGPHDIYVSFIGSEIYQPTRSAAAAFDVDYVTNLDINASKIRVKQGAPVNITAILHNSSQPLEGRSVTLFFDDGVLAKMNTDSAGTIVCQLNTTNMSTGTHIVKAYFQSGEKMYTSAVSEMVFLYIYVESSDTVNPPPPPPPPDRNPIYDWLWLILLIVVIMALAVALVATDTLRNLKGANLRRKTKAEEAKAMAKAGISSEILTLPGGAVSDTGGGIDFAAMPPNAAIIWRYSTLLASLSEEKRVQILPTMTAREIARLLVAKSYPGDSVYLITHSFERAKYSVEILTGRDWRAFETAADAVQGFAGVAS